MLTVLLTGFLTCMAIIVAIGPQSAWLLRQGLRRDHVVAAILACVLGDIVLIVLGTAGVGAVLDYAPWLLEVLRWAGVAYLLFFAVASFRSARKPGKVVDLQDSESQTADSVPNTLHVQLNSEHDAGSGPSITTATLPVVQLSSAPTETRVAAGAPVKNASKLSTVIAAGLTFSILNPHAWVDSLVLLGTMANSFGEFKWFFAIGAILAGVFWHSVVAGGASAFAGLLNRPRIWQAIDVLVGVTMVAVAALLAFNGLLTPDPD